MPRRKSLSDDEILDAAVPVMVRKGPSAFTLADVATEVGMAPATLIQRFGDKKTLIERVFARDNERFAEWVAGLPRGRGVDAVLHIFESATNMFGEEDNLADHLLWLREDFRDPTLNAMARERFRLLQKALAERMPPMRVSAKTAARLLDAQWQGALNQWGIFRQGRLSNYMMKSLRDWFRMCSG